MKHLTLIFAVALIAFGSCKKTTNTPSNNNKSTGCADGYICFTLDGTDISKQAGGYELADTFLFVKYEDGSAQLSLDIFSKNTGSLKVTDARQVGNARIYYFPGGSNGKMFMAETGTFNVSAYDATNRKISGSFAATLYEYDNTNKTFNKSSSVEIKNGTFKNVTVPK